MLLSQSSTAFKNLSKKANKNHSKNENKNLTGDANKNPRKNASKSHNKKRKRASANSNETLIIKGLEHTKLSIQFYLQEIKICYYPDTPINY